jgi:hypothetical protein
MRKLFVMVESRIGKLIEKEAKKRGCSVQSLIRAVIVGEWIERNDSA